MMHSNRVWSVREILAGKDDHHDFRQEVTAILQTPEEHGSCDTVKVEE